MGDQTCHFTAVSAIVEVQYLPEAIIDSEWFRREGIEPVGSVTSDAVGIAQYTPPGSSVADGFTIAMISRRHGAIVAVTGTPENRALAEQVASIVDSST